MQKAIIGRKVGMTQLFDENGRIVPVTVIEAGPCVVTQKKANEKEGYASVQLGFEDVPERKLTKPEVGHLKKSSAPMKKHLKEFRLDDDSSLNIGDIIKADVFSEGDRVDVTGVSKGKGFAGTIKRFNTHRGAMSHGGGPVHRHAGSMSAAASPGRIPKGKKMPGHMGAEQVTVQNLDVVMVDSEQNVIAVRGAVPGPKGGIVFSEEHGKERLRRKEI